MTTYNTGNPVGSTDVRDLYDNAQNLDSLVNGPLASYDDRLGAPRKSWRGIEQDFAAFLAASGFELPALEYVGGSPLVVDRPTQLIFRTGFPDTLYGVKSTEPFPATLSGTWSTDEGRLVVRSDGDLRQDLANSTDPAKGAGLVGFDPAVDYSGGVGGELNANSPTIPARTVTLSEVMAKTAHGGTIVINCYGDSMTYGFDVSSTTGDLLPGINGSSATRALYQYPEAMGAALNKAGISATVNNYGFPGDTAVQGKTRFPSAVACDVAFVMFGHNDAAMTAGEPRTTPEEFKNAIDFIIRREQQKGAFVVLLTPPRLKEANLAGHLDRQRYMRIFESCLHQLAGQFSIPCVSVDELVRHRGDEIYSDTIHFNKYGYNEWGWNLSALLIQRSDAPIRISDGTVIQASGSSITGEQSVVDGKTVLRATPTVPLCVSGYFTEDVICRVHTTYSTVVGGVQRVKSVMDGGIRNAPVARVKVASSPAAPGRILNSDVIKAGYRTMFLEVAATTTVLYVDHVEFVSASTALFTDSKQGQRNKRSVLEGVSLPAEADAGRFIIDDGSPLVGDFTIDTVLQCDPPAGESAGIILVSEFNEITGLNSRSITFSRIPSNAAFIRLQLATNTDEAFTAAFPAGPETKLRITRRGDEFSFYANDVLLKTLTHPFYRLLPAVTRSNAAVTVDYFDIAN